MNRIVFVVALYLTGAACLLMGLVAPSLAWFIGGVVLLVLAHVARKKLRDEWIDGERGERSSSFTVWSLSLSGVALLLLMFFMWRTSRM